MYREIYKDNIRNQRRKISKRIMGIVFEESGSFVINSGRR